LKVPEPSTGGAKGTPERLWISLTTITNDNESDRVLPSQAMTWKKGFFFNTILLLRTLGSSLPSKTGCSRPKLSARTHGLQCKPQAHTPQVQQGQGVSRAMLPLKAGWGTPSWLLLSFRWLPEMPGALG